MFEVAIAPSFDFLSEEYAVLFADSQATAFQHPVWLAALYQDLVGPLNAIPLVVTVRDSSGGRLIMVLPMLRRRHAGLQVVECADLGVSDYVYPVANEATINAIADCDATCARITAALKPFDLLRLQKLRSCSTQVMKLFGVGSCAPMPVSAHAVPLGSSLVSWRDGLPTSFRKELDKKFRRLHRRGYITFEVAENPDVLRGALAGMRDFRRRRFDRGDLLQDQVYFDFYLDVATRGQGALVRLYTIRSDGELIASAMGLSYRGSLLVILSGFDQDNFKRQSLGSLIFAMIAEHSIATNDRELDFTIGDEPYKSSFGAQRTPIYQAWKSGSATGAIAQVVVQRMPWVKKILRFK